MTITLDGVDKTILAAIEILKMSGDFDEVSFLKGVIASMEDTESRLQSRISDLLDRVALLEDELEQLR